MLGNPSVTSWADVVVHASLDNAGVAVDESWSDNLTSVEGTSPRGEVACTLDRATSWVLQSDTDPEWLGLLLQAWPEPV